jgi:cytochrome c-type biogenesis protein CcmF
VCSAIFITVGTSSPLITTILQGKASAVDISYYVTTNLPLGIAIGLLSGLGQLLWWNRTEKTGFVKVLSIPVGFAILATVSFLVLSSLNDFRVVMFVFAAAFALAANLQVGWRIVKGNPKFAGGSIAHVGLAVMFLGFVGSSKYDQKETLSLAQGQTVHCLGNYKLTYTGYKPIENGKKFAFEVNVESEGRQFTIAPIMFKNNEDIMRNPDILNLVTKDFYLAPLSLEAAGSQDNSAMQTLLFKKGETKKIGQLEVTFMDYDFPANQRESMVEGKDSRIGAILVVRQYGKKPVELVPSKTIGSTGSVDNPAIFDGKHQFVIVNMKPNDENSQGSSVEIGYKDLTAAPAAGATNGETLVVEASVKPYINLVWSGVIVVLVGFIVTIVRRTQEARLLSEAVE